LADVCVCVASAEEPNGADPVRPLPGGLNAAKRNCVWTVDEGASALATPSSLLLPHATAPQLPMIVPARCRLNPRVAGVNGIVRGAASERSAVSGRVLLSRTGTRKFRAENYG
jgi:hypothetical protein